MCFTINIYSNDNDLLDEYKLLYTDLQNIQTYGYKSFYNSQLNKATTNINLDQGAIEMTGYTLNCAILNKQSEQSVFFKIRLENNRIAYTRNGEFKFNSEGELVTKQGYSLFAPIYLGDTFLPDTFNVRQDHSIYVKYANGEEKNIGKLLIYKVQENMLEHFTDSIYTVKNNQANADVLVFENDIIGGALEMSNFPLLPVLLRLYYILSNANEQIIPNLEFKKNLVKIQIEKEANRQPNDHVDVDLNYLEQILPFIKYDY
jgi:flagellar basal body rod protein FlgF